MAGDTWLNLVRDTVKFSCNVRSVQMTNSLIQEVLLSNPSWFTAENAVQNSE